jgi:carbonic anhydrase
MLMQTSTPQQGAFIMRSRTTFTGFVAWCLLALAGNVAVGKDHPVASVSPDVALARLKAGNARFVARPVSTGKPTAARRAETAQTQQPFAIIVGCADSRTAPELVFDQNIGDLFVVRTAGNLVDDYGLGSIEYAVDHLGTRLIVVLGHERCGAVAAAMASATAPGHVNALVHDIQPAVAAAKTEKGDPLTNAVKANARLMAAKIGKEAKLGQHKAEVRIVTGYYDLDTGVVEWADADKTEK